MGSRDRCGCRHHRPRRNVCRGCDRRARCVRGRRRALDATFALPEFGPGATFPGARAIGFHFIDYVVHGWDVARSLGVAFELPSEVVAAVMPLALAAPDDGRRGTGAPFMSAVPGSGEVGDLDRILAHLGRSPAWPRRVSC